MESIELLIILGFIGISFGILLFVINRKLGALRTPTTSDPALLQWLQTIQQSLDKSSAVMTQTLNQNNKDVTDTLTKTTALLNHRLDTAVGIVADASKEIARMNELGNSIKELQMVLQSPKMRGGLGEEILSDMLGQVFPKGSFFLQHSFKSGVKVDAAIKTAAGSLCIDAKFPMESFQKMCKAETDQERKQHKQQFITDVKKHIKDISNKYILPEEGTVDFAFMYIPSETVFYEIANIDDILEFARHHRVYPVSPNTLYAHLQTVLLSFEGQKIEVRAKQIMSLLKSMQKDYSKLEDNLQTLGRHLNNASNQYSQTNQQFTLLGQKLNQQELLEDGEN